MKFSRFQKNKKKKTTTTTTTITTHKSHEAPKTYKIRNASPKGYMSKNIYWGEETLPPAKLPTSGMGSSRDRFWKPLPILEWDFQCYSFFESSRSLEIMLPSPLFIDCFTKLDFRGIVTLVCHQYPTKDEFFHILLA